MREKQSRKHPSTIVPTYGAPINRDFRFAPTGGAGERTKTRKIEKMRVISYSKSYERTQIRFPGLQPIIGGIGKCIETEVGRANATDRGVVFGNGFATKTRRHKRKNIKFKASRFTSGGQVSKREESIAAKIVDTP